MNLAFTILTIVIVYNFVKLIVGILTLLIETLFKAYR